MSGDDWVRAFCERNKLTSRMVSNISKERGRVDKGTVDEFFDRLVEAGIKEVKP